MYMLKGFLAALFLSVIPAILCGIGLLVNSDGWFIAGLLPLMGIWKLFAFCFFWLFVVDLGRFIVKSCDEEPEPEEPLYESGVGTSRALVYDAETGKYKELK